MKSFLNLIVAIPSFLLSTGCNSQINNAKTLTATIDGNCGMCEATIEKVANQKKVAALNWNKDTKQAIISYDGSKTNPDDILKRVALAGYDNEKFLAPTEAYAALPECCKYERTRNKTKVESNNTSAKTETGNIIQSITTNQFKPVFDLYFEMKNALVNSDFKTAGTKASDLSGALSKIDMSLLDNTQHEIWMKVNKNLIAKSDLIAKSKNIEDQRTHFMTLSQNLHDLAKVAKPESPIYYQHCPMYNNGMGADWLSRENAVKNPYYGSQMLTCGKTTETIK